MNGEVSNLCVEEIARELICCTDCAGKKWSYFHVADAAYLRGTTADDPLPKDRLATYEYDSSDDEGGFGSSPRKIWKFRNYLPEDDEKLVMMSLR